MRLEIQIPDELFELLRKTAESTGRAVEHLILDAVENSVSTSDEDAVIQGMFTAERLAHIDRALGEARSGYFTSEQVKNHFEQKEAAWREKESA